MFLERLPEFISAHPILSLGLVAVTFALIANELSRFTRGYRALTPALLTRYRKNLAAYQAAISGYCRQRGIQFMSTSTSEPFDKLVLSQLRKRGLVK